MKRVSSVHEEASSETAPQRQGPSRETHVDPTLNSRSWATLKRVMPREVYEEAVYFEQLIATHSGIPARYQGIGDSVSVWSVLIHHLRDTEAELVALAKEWSEKQ